MISALSSLDLSLFRVVNAIVWPDWASAILSALARSNLWIAPIALAFLILAVLGGRRERTYVAAALLTLALTEVLSSGVLKPLIARPRPCNVLEGVRLLGGCTQSFAMPSGHAANSFAQAMVLGLFYRSSFFFSLPLAAMVALSRVTDGKHYPSDVLVGAVVGVLVAAAVVRGLRARVEAGDRRLSRLLSPAGRVSGPEARAGMRPASVFASALGVAMIIRLWYVGWANLTPEEAILWDRARFISGWGWLSATPAGALAWAGTRLLGHTELGVRVGALAASLLTSVLLFFWARKAFPWSRWAGTIAGTGILAAPLFGIGGAHLTAVTLSLLFWTGALAASQWAASRPTPKASGAWALWGLCVGLGLRTDPSAALLVPVTGLYLVVRSDGRPWLRRPAPYLGLALAAALAILPWVSGAGPGQAPAGGAEAGAVGGPGGLGFLLGWHALNVGPLLAAFMIWGVVW
ncbi:MAG: phosphatase PAP2 family protein, partial [Nitrospinota bacterium]